ncbi:MAG: hypothetical protein M3495_16260 [Pseudomonadota bacterium]|nr:hypothetical protein [Pseudomonadota bacterium]
MRYRVVHHTEYRYVQPVALCHNETHLRPRAVAHQRCLSHALVIDPEPDLISEREDFFGNPTASFSMQRGHSHLSVTATSEVEVGSPERPGQVADVPWEEAGVYFAHLAIACLCAHADHPITDRPIRRNSTGCKTAWNVLSFTS